MPDVRRNPNTNNIEILYRAKPSEKTLAALRAAGFRWSPRFKLWYGVPTKQTLALATRVDPDFRPGPFRQKRAPVQGPIASHAKPRARRRTKRNGIAYAEIRALPYTRYVAVAQDKDLQILGAHPAENRKAVENIAKALLRDPSVEEVQIHERTDDRGVQSDRESRIVDYVTLKDGKVVFDPQESEGPRGLMDVSRSEHFYASPPVVGTGNVFTHDHVHVLGWSESPRGAVAWTHSKRIAVRPEDVAFFRKYLPPRAPTSRRGPR